MLSDEDVLAAVRRRVEERGGTGPFSPGEAVVTRHLLIEGRVLRSLETRAEEERFHQGFVDLSDRPVYGSALDSYRIPPPRGPRRRDDAETGAARFGGRPALRLRQWPGGLRPLQGQR